MTETSDSLLSKNDLSRNWKKSSSSLEFNLGAVVLVPGGVLPLDDGSMGDGRCSPKSLHYVNFSCFCKKFPTKSLLSENILHYSSLQVRRNRKQCFLVINLMKVF